MQNASNDTKHSYKLILCSILIPEYDFRFNLNWSSVRERTSFDTWTLEVAITTYIKI